MGLLNIQLPPTDGIPSTRTPHISTAKRKSTQRRRWQWKPRRRWRWIPRRRESWRTHASARKSSRRTTRRLTHWQRPLHIQRRPQEGRRIHGSLEVIPKGQSRDISNGQHVSLVHAFSHIFRDLQPWNGSIPSAIGLNRLSKFLTSTTNDCGTTPRKRSNETLEIRYPKSKPSQN